MLPLNFREGRSGKRQKQSRGLVGQLEQMGSHGLAVHSDPEEGCSSARECEQLASGRGGVERM